MKTWMRILVVGLVVAIDFAGCSTTRGWHKVPRERVYMGFENKTPYILLCKIKEDGKIFAGAQRLKNIPAKAKSFIWLPPDRNFIIEGVAYVEGKPVARFVRPFATVNYEVRNDSLVVAESVIIDDIFSRDLPALSGVFVNMCVADTVTYIRVYNPQIPAEFITLRGFMSYDFMTVVSGPVKWVVEYYDKMDRLILRKVHSRELDDDPDARREIFHGGRVVDFRINVD